MYPYDEDDDGDILEEVDDDELDEEIEDGDDTDQPLEWGVDFETGKLTGGKVYGSKAVAVWAWNALMYPRYRYELTSWEFGNELEDLVGEVMDEEEREILVESIIMDALLPNEHIEGIDNLTCEQDGDHLNIAFTLLTEYGEEEMDVTV